MEQLFTAFDADVKQQIQRQKLGDLGWHIEVGPERYSEQPQEKKQHRNVGHVFDNSMKIHGSSLCMHEGLANGKWAGARIPGRLDGFQKGIVALGTRRTIAALSMRIVALSRKRGYLTAHFRRKAIKNEVGSMKERARSVPGEVVQTTHSTEGAERRGFV